MAPKLAIDIHNDAADLLQAPINFSSVGSNQVLAGVPGAIIRIYKIFFIVGASTNITYQDGTSFSAINVSGPLAFAASEGMVLDFDTKPWLTCGSGNSFILNQSGTAQVSGIVYYTQG